MLLFVTLEVLLCTINLIKQAKAGKFFTINIQGNLY